MFKIRNYKVRRAIILASAAVVVGSAAFILAHTHQSMKVQPVVPPSSIVSNGSSSENVISKTPSKINTKPESKISHGKGIKEPASVIRPRRKPQVNMFAELKSKYGLLSIPTYDGSNQETHPKVLYFPNGWHGYRYWMSMTPYPYTIASYENPSIVVSNDGTNWSVPAGLKNPISGIPSDVRIGGHFSDSHLVMRNNVMELWYRYNPGNPKTHSTDYRSNIYYKKTSTDGIHWSAAKYLSNFGGDGHYSMAINYEDGMYKAWYATNTGKLCFSQSSDSMNWSSPIVCSVPLPAGYCPYHQDMIKIGSQYCLLQCAQRGADYTFAQFFATSTDGIHFTNVKRFYPTGDTALWNNISIYRSSMFEKDGKLEMYLTLWFQKLNVSWYIKHVTFPLSEFLSPASSAPSQPSKSSSAPSPSSSSSNPSSEPPKSSAGSGILPSSEVPKPPAGVLPVSKLLSVKLTK